jgi:hypothetical protein
MLLISRAEEPVDSEDGGPSHSGAFGVWNKIISV